MLYISSENAVAPDYEEKKKKRTGEHGYGLKILEETAEKYGGTWPQSRAAVFSPVPLRQKRSHMGHGYISADRSISPAGGCYRRDGEVYI